MTSICNGNEYNQLIYDIFAECVINTRNLVGVILGLISILCWFVAQFPQFLKNYQNKSVESLSFLFILNWISGDLTNLMGCILTKQSPTQLYLAYYFVTSDLFLVNQYLYYYFKPYILIQTLLNRWRSRAGNSDSEGSDTTPFQDESSKTVVDECNTSQTSLAIAKNSKSLEIPRNSKYNALETSNSNSDVSIVNNHSTAVFAVAAFLVPYVADVAADSVSAPLQTSRELIGVVISWTCALLYLTSRIPQIYRNYVRKSTDGLSMSMFRFAFLGNLTYTFSIFLKANDIEEVYPAIPFILGSGGTLVFDAVIYYQYRMYKYHEYALIPSNY